MRKILIVICLAFLSGGLAEIAAKGAHEDQFELRKYEFSVSGAAYPGFCAFGYDFNYPFKGYDIEDIYDRYSYDEKDLSSGTWTFAFTYNFTKIIALEVSLSYEGGWRRTYLKADAAGRPDIAMDEDLLVMKESQNYISPLAHLRVSWLNRRTVRMYSSFGAGAAFCFRKDGDIKTPGVLTPGISYHPAFQFNPVGISVGKSLYGLAELGIGNLFCGIRLGAGYRF